MEAFLNMMWASGGPGESWDHWGAGGGGSEGDAGGTGCCKDGGGKGGGGKNGGGYGKKGGKKGKGGGGKDGGKGGKFGGGKGKVETKIANGEMLFHGQVKAFNVEKKHGYIYCEDIYYQCSQDVYAFADVLERGCAGPGDLVCFFVHWSPKGQPQASSPLLRIAANEGYWALKGQFKAAKDPSSGFGFIECAETKEFFGRDVYVNKDLAATATPGEVVRFNAYLNRDGMPNASNMESLDDPFWEPEATDISVSWSAPGVGKGGKKGKGGGKGKKGDAGWGASWPALPSGNVTDKGDGKGKKGSGKGKKGSAAQPQPTGESHTGTIKSFNWDNNYGFIACEEVTQRFGFDVFVHGKELQGQDVGEQVMFELGINSKGQPQAMNVVSMSGGEASSPVQPGPAAKRQKVESPDEAAAAALSAMNAIAQGMGQPTMDESGAWAWGAGSTGAPGVVV